MALLALATMGGVAYMGIAYGTATKVTRLAITTLVVSLFYNRFVAPDSDYGMFDLVVCIGIAIGASRVMN